MNELSCSISLIRDATSDADQRMREERKATITDLYLKAYTSEEICNDVGLTRQQVDNEVSQISTDLVKFAKVQFSDDSWTPPIYNVWSFAKKSNKTDHFGNTEQRIVENLL